MKGFYWYGTGVRCGYCGQRGHNITTCKIVDYHATAALQKMTANSSYICNPLEHAALIETKKREERKTKKRKPRKASTCSYCKSKDHKRPNCDKLKQFRQKVYRANKNWKRLFVKRVNEVGCGIGALVKFDEGNTYSYDFNLDSHMIGMIVGFDLSKLNVFCALTGYSDYQSDATMKVLSGERSDNISIKYLASKLGYDLLNEGWWFSQARPKVISPMPWSVDPEWLDSEWDEVLDWFFTKISEFEMIDKGIISFIDNWQ